MSAVATKPLTATQEKALRLFGDGMTMQEVADEMGVSKRTAKYFSDRLRAKLGVDHKRELVIAARAYFERG